MKALVAGNHRTQLPFYYARRFLEVAPAEALPAALLRPFFHAGIHDLPEDERGNRGRLPSAEITRQSMGLIAAHLRQQDHRKQLVADMDHMDESDREFFAVLLRTGVLWRGSIPEPKVPELQADYPRSERVERALLTDVEAAGAGDPCDELMFRKYLAEGDPWSARLLRTAFLDAGSSVNAQLAGTFSAVSECFGASVEAFGFSRLVPDPDLSTLADLIASHVRHLPVALRSREAAMALVATGQGRHPGDLTERVRFANAEALSLVTESPEQALTVLADAAHDIEATDDIDRVDTARSHMMAVNLINTAQLVFRQEGPGVALQILDRAVLLEGPNQQAAVMRAKWLHQSGIADDEIIDYLDGLHRQHPEWAMLRAELCHVLARAGHIAGAALHADVLSDVFPANSAYPLLVTSAALDAGDLGRAREWCRRIDPAALSTAEIVDYELMRIEIGSHASEALPDPASWVRAELVALLRRFPDEQQILDNLEELNG